MNEDNGQKIYQVGKCVLTDRMIYWDGINTGNYQIAVSTIWGETGDDKKYFDWLLHLLSRSWLTLEDLNDVNLVFAFAFDYFERPEGCQAKLSDTLLKQKEQRENNEKIKPQIEKMIEIMNERQEVKKADKE